jgi:hypothetical protein
VEIMQRKKLLNIMPWVVALLALACASPEAGPPERSRKGTLELPLSVESGGVTYRFLGTINISNVADCTVAATVETNPSSPSTHTVSLLPGSYLIEIEDGYTCSVDPDDASFTGCTYIGASPNPFGVRAGGTTEVLLEFTFHFDEDVGIVFRKGNAVLSLVPTLQAACGEGCPVGELCVSLDAEAPACAATCEANEDCGDEQACYPIDDNTESVCAHVGGALVWTRQFGSSNDDHARAVGLAGNGDVVVAGRSGGPFSGGGGAGAFVRRYDDQGTELWTHHFGVGGAEAMGVSVDSDGNVIVVGWSDGLFIHKFDSSGVELWADSFTTGTAMSVSTDGNDDIFIAGYVSVALPGQIHAGNSDAFLRKYDADGTELWTEQFGSSAADYGRGVTIDANGDVSVVGYTEGTLPGQPGGTGPDGFIRKFTNDGAEQWTMQTGFPGSEYAFSISADAFGDLFIAGYTYGSLPGQASSGNLDAYVGKYSAAGELVWLRQFGSSSWDEASSVSVDAQGHLVAVGHTRYGALPGQTNLGEFDAFARKYASDGTELWTRQFGSSATDYSYGVGTSPAGHVFVTGFTMGTLADQTSSGGMDAFVARLAP